MQTLQMITFDVIEKSTYIFRKYNKTLQMHLISRVFHTLWNAVHSACQYFI